jgi:hypothetical protein
MRLFLYLSFITAIALNTNALELKGVKFEDKIKVEGKDLVLNGAGIRKATFFKVKVYVAGLYTEKKESDPAKVLALPGPKEIQMEFLMNLERDKLTKAWNDSLSQHCPEDCSAVREGINTMNRYMKSVRKKDRFTFTVLADEVRINIDGAKKDPIKGKDFAQALLKVFIGPKEIDPGMAKGLLGLEK